jgi:WhiB family redox-sensing transcriptional regulator
MSEARDSSHDCRLMKAADPEIGSAAFMFFGSKSAPRTSIESRGCSTRDRQLDIQQAQVRRGDTTVLTATVPLDASGAPPDLISAGDTGVLDLLNAAPATGLRLPCRTYDADLWFADTPAELDRAKALCADCPVRAECLAGALARREPWGVWGGEIFERGAVIARKRPRGRPSKADIERDRQLTDRTSKEVAA